MLSRSTRYLLAAIQAVIAWEWLVSGINKLLSGTFPQNMPNTLNDGIKGNPNGWYVSFLQSVVLPHGLFFGYLIEWGELAIGLLLLGGALFLLRRQRARGESQYGISVGLYAAVTVAALLGAFFCVNFHFWAGHGLIPGLNGAPGDEGVDLDALVPPFSLIIAFANLALISHLRGFTWFNKLQNISAKVSYRDGGTVTN